MSIAPRPQISPSTRSPPKGGRCHAWPRGRDDVDVALQQERRAVACALEPGDEVRPGRILRVGLRLAARLFEEVPDEADALRFVPRRVRGVEPDQLLEELDGVIEVKAQ